jgi:hypothetical protein
MVHEKYYKIKHRIDFYLEDKGVTDLSDYNLGKPALINDNKDVNILHWGYIVPRPTYDELKQLFKRSNFIDHRNKNMVIFKLEFVLKIKFSPGTYKRGEIIYDKYKDYPYIWFITPPCTSLMTSADFIRFKVVNSILYINNDFVVPPVVENFYLSCILIPKKDIGIQEKYLVIMNPTGGTPKKTIITSMNRGQIEQKEVEIIEMPPPQGASG